MSRARRGLVVLAFTFCVACGADRHSDHPRTRGPVARPSLSVAPGEADRPGELSLRLVAERNLAPGSEVSGQMIGGVSALVYRPRDRRLLALSDGRGAHGPNRLFLLDADRLAPLAAIPLGGLFADEELDTEGMAPGWDREIWVATEGDGRRTPRLAPAIWRLDASWRTIARVPLPPALVPTPTGALTRGVRHNRGIEGLTASPPGAGAHRVIAAVEQALVQDGPLASFEAGTRVRMVVYDAPSGYGAQYAYLTDPVPAPVRAGRVTDAELGVSALAALTRERLLVMERSAVAVDGRFTNRVRIYEVSLTGAVDVSGQDALTPATAVLAKRLVLDLDDIIGELDPQYARLDNFEAMALGYDPHGAPRLFVASDDNFSDDQRTALLVFAIEGL